MLISQERPVYDAIMIMLLDYFITPQQIKSLAVSVYHKVAEGHNIILLANKFNTLLQEHPKTTKIPHFIDAINEVLTKSDVSKDTKLVLEKIKIKSEIQQFMIVMFMDYHTVCVSFRVI